MTITILPTRNTDWGFFGTAGGSENTAAEPAIAWDIASRKIANATGAAPEGVRDFLDSRHGRHFADDVTNGLWKGETLEPAIDAAIARWMDWRIDRATSRDTGIPQGLPYLTASSSTTRSWPSFPTDRLASRIRRASSRERGSGS